MQETAMATTQLMRAVCCETHWMERTEAIESRSPRLSWVVVTDENHNRRVQMRWTPPAEGR